MKRPATGFAAENRRKILRIGGGPGVARSRLGTAGLMVGAPVLAGGWWLGVPLLLLSGVVVAFVGLLVRASGGAVFAMVDGTVRVRRGPLGGWQSVTYPRGAFEVVSIDRRSWEDWSERRHERFTAGLGRVFGDLVRLGEFTSYARARRCAEAAATALGLPLADTTVGRSVRVPGELDRSFRDTPRDPFGELPLRPEGCRIGYTRAGGEATFEIPPARPPILEAMVGPSLLLAAVTLLAHGHMPVTAAGWREVGLDHERIVVLAAGLVMGVIGAGQVGLNRWRARRGTRVTVAGSGITVTAPRYPWHRPRLIGWRDAEELLVGSDDLCLRGDRGEICIGRGLDREELDWLAGMLRRQAAAQPVSADQDAGGASGAA